MFENLKSDVKATICLVHQYSNSRNLIFTGSLSDYVQYKKLGAEPIQPKDIDIIITNLNDLGLLKDKLKLEGPFINPIYQGVYNNTQQYYCDIYGVRLDIFIMPNMNNLDIETNSFLGMSINTLTKEQNIKNHISSLEIFEKHKDSVELFRFRKHSKRLSFYNMLENQIL
jgi:hypothetical protein